MKSFESQLIEHLILMGEKANPCHAPDSGRFCSTGDMGGGALEKLNNLPGVSGYGAGEVKAPFEHVSFSSFMSENRDKVKGPAQEGTVSLNNLSAIQETVNKDSVTNLIKNFDFNKYNQDLPVVMKSGNKFVARDGTHRLAALKLMGQSTARVNIIEYK